MKTILEVGDNHLGKPGRPYIVKVTLKGYFAKDEREKVEENWKTLDVNATHIRVPADELKDIGEVFVEY